MIAVLVALATLADARLAFTKSFPQSQPPYVKIVVEQSGAGEFRTSPDDDQPVKFQLNAADTTKLFETAEAVRFAEKLESPAKVAKMGLKTLHYEKDGKMSEQTFNYTEQPEARTLTDWFERMSETERCYIDLERSAKYEKIGVNEVLLQLQDMYEKKRLLAAQQFLPLLDRITKGESYLNMARNRAAGLAMIFRGLP